MSLAVSVRIERRGVAPALLSLHGGVLIAIGWSAMLLQSRWGLASLLTGLLLSCASLLHGLRGWRRLPSGTLDIDGDGVARWRSDAEGRWHAFEPVSCHFSGRQAWIGGRLMDEEPARGSDAGAKGGPVRLGLGIRRSALGDDQWRRLRRWTVWRARGGKPD